MEFADVCGQPFSKIKEAYFVEVVRVLKMNEMVMEGDVGLVSLCANIEVFRWQRSVDEESEMSVAVSGECGRSAELWEEW